MRYLFLGCMTKTWKERFWTAIHMELTYHLGTLTVSFGKCCQVSGCQLKLSCIACDIPCGISFATPADLRCFKRHLFLMLKIRRHIWQYTDVFSQRGCNPVEQWSLQYTLLVYQTKLASHLSNWSDGNHWCFNIWSRVDIAPFRSFP
jgi:hypothetical protein